MQYQCVKKCYWEGVFWSPQPDGRTIYDGNKEPPKGKDGVSFFKPLVREEFKVSPTEEVGSKAWEPTQAVMEKWALQKLNKAELLSMLRNVYKTEAEDDVTRKELIDIVLEKKLKLGSTNQEMASALKG